MSFSEAQLAAYEAELARELAGFSVRYKDESRLQRAIGWALRPINPRYLTGYTTVMFGRVYFPSRAWRQARGPVGVYEILRHEAVHLRDMRRFPVFFQLSYLFLMPSVVTFRAFWELRAYAETLHVSFELRGEIPDALLSDIEDRFVGADYLFMWPFRGAVRRRLERARREIMNVESAKP